MQVFVPDAGKVTCTFADHLANILWSGHHDGKVSAHSMGDAPGTAANGQLLHCWQVGLAVRGGSCPFYDGRVLTFLSIRPCSVLPSHCALMASLSLSCCDFSRHVEASSLIDTQKTPRPLQ